MYALALKRTSYTDLFLISDAVSAALGVLNNKLSCYNHVFVAELVVSNETIYFSFTF